MSGWRHLASGLLCGLLSILPLGAQTMGDTRDSVLAREEFRRGVFAYNRSSFNEAILAFEKALGYLSDEALIFEWLGNAYYRSGFDDTATRQWEFALARYRPTESRAILLSSRMEIVRNRRRLYPAVDETERYVEAAAFRGMNGETTVFRNPTAVLPLDDGTVWVVAHGSNELVRLDINGIVRQRVNGPINGFDRPWDIARSSEGTLYVSEQRGGRVSVLDTAGSWQRYIGKRGRGPGELMGPQHLCLDGEGNLLVVDYGNMRVQKFSPGGDYLLDFGDREGNFPGFRSPAGIAWLDGLVWVADAVHKTIFRFDMSGNYMGSMAEGAFRYPESLRVDGDRRLLVADTSGIVVLDPATGRVDELGSLGNAGGRLVGAAVDRNANILVANHAANEVNVLSRMDDLSAGMYVRVERIDASLYPEIRCEVKVEDRRRRPVVGLRELNFLIQEEGRPVRELRYLGTGDLEERVDLSLVIERSQDQGITTERLSRVVEDLVASGANLRSVVQALDEPVLEKPSTPSSLASALRGPTSRTSRAKWSFDRAIRLAATDAITASAKRAVVFVGTGTTGASSFARYSLHELSSYLSNNGIMFIAVLLSPSADTGELEYLASRTGGEVIHAFRPEGSGPLVALVRSMAVGTYSFSYRSELDSDWGQRFLPLEVEVYLHSRSGRDATNYFAPLQ